MIELYRNLKTYNNLSEIQKITADRWDREKIDRELYLVIYLESLKSNDKLLEKEALSLLGKTDYYCEHNRSIMSTCIACYEIEQILLPELFTED
tara:strand:+ start:1067 stop:1348 length:282 start_codon:yes stop_codon:yes gene_type:complete